MASFIIEDIHNLKFRINIIRIRMVNLRDGDSHCHADRQNLNSTIRIAIVYDKLLLRATSTRKHAVCRQGVTSLTVNAMLYSCEKSSTSSH